MTADRWWESAACAGTDPEAFFPTPRSTLREVNTAYAICKSCQVRNECRDAATTEGATWGIWGGVNLAPATEQGLRRKSWQAKRQHQDEMRAVLAEQRAELDRIVRERLA